MNDARIAGLLLLLTAVTTGVGVAARLAGSDEAMSGTGPESQPGLPIILDNGVYAGAAAARTLSGLALLAAAAFMRRMMAGWRLPAMGATVGLLAASGAATAVSGASMAILAASWNETGTAAGWSTVGAAGAVPAWTEAVNETRRIAGALGFTLAGLGLVAMAPGQWRVGGLLKISAVSDVIIGAAMLFIWVDAATVIHRISGVAFLLWLVISGVWIAAGLLKPPAPAARATETEGAPASR